MTGGKELRRNADTMGANVNSCARTACWKMAGKIATLAKHNVHEIVIPKSAGGTTTGRLAGSITVAANFTNEVIRLNNPATPADGLIAPGGNQDELPFAVTGTNLEYARRIEFGFVGKDILGRTYNQAAKPYLYPAFFDRGKDLKKILKDAVDKRKALRYFKKTLPYFDPGGIED